MQPRQEIEIRQFDADQIERSLNLVPPPFIDEDVAIRQFRYVLRYAAERGCLSIVLESHYIDRDHIEDHSAFYSKSLQPYNNWCQRLHFFQADGASIEQSLQDLLEISVSKGREEHRSACQAFSDRFYLGFCVIKPLSGSPVGRTVLRIPDRRPADANLIRSFDGTREYRVHLLGSELRVQGLAFQQQDLGVSACATTAIWTSLQKARDFEEIASATPSQITTLASRYALPFGRAMPSEGLSIDQMCQAIQAIGVSPNIYRADNYQVARTYLHMACRSGIASIAVLKDEHETGWHAVTVAGMKTVEKHIPEPLGETVEDTSEFASDLKALYVHDDRHGPYLRADLIQEGDKAMLVIEVDGREQRWFLRQLIAPIHGKVRLSFSDLTLIGQSIAFTVHAWREQYFGDKQPNNPFVTFGTWVVKISTYIDALLARKVPAATVANLCKSVRMPRYVGIVYLESEYFDPLEVLIDSTGTIRSSHSIAVLALQQASAATANLCTYLAEEYDCQAIL